MSIFSATIRAIKEIFLPYILSIIGYLLMVLKVFYRLIVFNMVLYTIFGKWSKKVPHSV